MKKKMNLTLGIITAICFLINILSAFIWMGYIEIGSYIGLIDRLTLYFPAVSFFFLQLLLCRNVRKKIVRVLPLFIIAIVALTSGIGYFIVGGGWDGLVFFIILMFCAAPMVGCVLGLAVDWFWRKKDYAVNKLTPVFMLVFPVLVIGVCVFEDWYSWQGVRTVDDIPSKEAVVTYLEEAEEKYVPTELVGFHQDQLHQMWGGIRRECFPAFGVTFGQYPIH